LLAFISLRKQCVLAALVRAGDEDTYLKFRLITEIRLQRQPRLGGLLASNLNFSSCSIKRGGTQAAMEFN